MNYKVFFISLILTISSFISKAVPRPDSLNYGRFGKLMIYKPIQEPDKVVICISGDGGWNQGIQNIAFKTLSPGTLLIGVDIRKYLRALNQQKSNCLYPAADFESISQYVQKKLGYKTYSQPVLLGYSSGAALVYGILAQAPQNTFIGGVVFGFCPDIRISKPLCKGSGNFTCVKRKDNRGYDIGPNTDMNSPIISMQGKIDEICNYEATVSFLKNVPKSEVISLEKVGYGYSIEKNWVPQFTAAYNRLVDNYEKEDKEMNSRIRNNLPLHITEAGPGATNDYMVLMISGDGGWTDFDQKVSSEFAKNGIPVIGLNALKYFWQQKSPVQTAQDVDRLINQYASYWKKEKVILLGYSFGADVIPFIFNRLNNDTRKKIAAVSLLSPSYDTDFEIHISDMLNIGSGDKELNVPEEIIKIKDTHLVCFFGEDEEETPANILKSKTNSVIMLPGGHHYDNNFAEIFKHTINL